MTTTNFVQFNTSKNNMQNDQQYQSNNTRINGLTTGLADSKLHNKLFYQLSTLSTAIASFINNKGYDANDDNLSTLIDNLTNALKSNVYESMTATSNGGGYNLDSLGISGTNSRVSYCCFGDIYGGLIIQSGIVNNTVENGQGCFIQFPISFRKSVIAVICTDGGSGCFAHGLYFDNLTGFHVYALNIASHNFTMSTFNYIAIGY